MPSVPTSFAVPPSTESPARKSAALVPGTIPVIYLSPTVYFADESVPVGFAASFRTTVSLYVRVDPLPDLHLTLMIFVPTLSFLVPVPVIVEVAATAVAFTEIEETVFSTTIEYFVVALLNPGVRLCPATAIFFR